MMESFLHGEKKLPFIFMSISTLSDVSKLLKMCYVIVKYHKNRVQIL